MKKDAVLFCTVVLNLALGRQAKANRKAIHHAIKTAFSRGLLLSDARLDT